jgi:hypothetical protein
MTRLYIKCFYADGSQILGNMDGQAVITARNYKRTFAYKRLKQQIVKNPAWMNGRVDHAKVVTTTGKVLETVS